MNRSKLITILKEIYDHTFCLNKDLEEYTDQIDFLYSEGVSEILKEKGWIVMCQNPDHVPGEGYSGPPYIEVSEKEFIDSLYSRNVSEGVCGYCRKPSKPFYDSELKAEICPLCKAYWKSHLTPEISGKDFCKCESVETTDVAKWNEVYHHVLCKKPVYSGGVSEVDKIIEIIEHYQTKYNWHPDGESNFIMKRKLANEIINISHPQPISEEPNAWPLKNVLAKLVLVSEIWMRKSDYDGHEYEEVEICIKRGHEILKELNNE